eukprot:1137369-Pelagomonas_calceolata.AAC.6
MKEGRQQMHNACTVLLLGSYEGGQAGLSKRFQCPLISLVTSPAMNLNQPPGKAKHQESMSEI